MKEMDTESEGESESEFLSESKSDKGKQIERKGKKLQRKSPNPQASGTKDITLSEESAKTINA